jgi:3'-5' exoribonuclease
VSRTKPPLARLCDLASGDHADFFALLVARSRGTTREGDPYYTCRFQDARRSVASMIWTKGPWFEHCEKDWREGCCYKIRAVYGEHEKYGPQIEIHNIRPVTAADRSEGFDEASLVEHSRQSASAMLAELRSLAESEIVDQPLRQLVITLLDRHGGRLERLPATLNKFFPFAGGWLEHTLLVTRHCILLADRYIAHYTEMKPPLNRDLVVASAILHDIGRVVEFDGSYPLPEPTVAGRFFGHLILARDLVHETAREVEGIDPTLLALLEHIILTHLTLPEWGSPRLPLVPECLILHHADDLDAKLEMYIRCITRDKSTGPFTERDPVLNRQLFKGQGG